MARFRMLRRTTAILTVGMALTLAGCATTTMETGSAAPDRDQEQGQQQAQKMGRQPEARNVILFVGDGMGVSTVTAIRIMAGQMDGQNGEEHALSWESFPNLALIKTYNSNQQVPDSAGTATAMLSGQKTKAGVIGLSDASPRADCKASQGTEIETILERAEEEGLATGIVTTARLTHATPAAAYAHTSERDWESDADMPDAAKAAGCTDIAQQFVDFAKGDGMEVALGGGRRAFLPGETVDPEYPDKTGVRLDGRNLVEEWQQKHPAGAYVWNRDQFDAVDPDTATHLFGLFDPAHMKYDADRGDDRGGEPSLSEMTEKAISMLERNGNGYFLLVEGGRIDHGHHEGNAYRALTDGVEMARAVEVATAMTSDTDTLIIVTADHSHSFAIAGYPTRGNPILGTVRGNDSHGAATPEPALADDGKPYTTVGYYTGPGAWLEGDRPDLADVNTENRDYIQQATVFRESAAHGGDDVAAYAQGPGADSVRGVMEQNLLWDVMMMSLWPRK